MVFRLDQQRSSHYQQKEQKGCMLLWARPPPVGAQKVSNTVNTVDIEFDDSWNDEQKNQIIQLLANELPKVMRDSIGRIQIVLQDKTDTRWNDFVKYWDDDGLTNIPHRVTYKVLREKAYIQDGDEKRSHYYMDYASRDSYGITYDETLEQHGKITWWKWIP